MLLVSVPSLIIGIPVPLSFVININRAGSLCHVLQDSISTSTAYEICCTGFHQYFYRVQSLYYGSQRSKRFRVVSEQRKTEERDFRFLVVRKTRNYAETLTTQASGTEFRYNIHCVGSLCCWIPSVHSPCAKSVVLCFIITFTW